MTVARTKTFRSGNSQAVRLPREVAFEDGQELEIVRSGDVMTIYPARMSLKRMVAKLRAMPPLPYIEERDEAEIPERPGL